MPRRSDSAQRGSDQAATAQQCAHWRAQLVAMGIRGTELADIIAPGRKCAEIAADMIAYCRGLV